MDSDKIAISAMLAQGIDPATGQPMHDPAPTRPERIGQPASVRTGRKKRTLGDIRPKNRPEPSVIDGFRFTIVDEPNAPPVRDDLDVLAVILPLEKYLAKRRTDPGGKLSGANRYRRTALFALEQQWTLEYWRARALHFERLQGIRNSLDEPPALRRR